MADMAKMTDPRSTPLWAVLSAATAPVLLVGGWTVAAAHQPPGFDPFVDTISALAARDASHRWIMTSALYGLGVCHLLTSAGLRAAGTGGRLLLALGGLATLFVATLPLSAASDARSHLDAATVAFVSLAVWPLAAQERAPTTPRCLRRPMSIAATVGLLGLLGWLVLALRMGVRVGLAERVSAGAQALWPLVVTATSFDPRRLR